MLKVKGSHSDNTEDELFSSAVAARQSLDFDIYLSHTSFNEMFCLLRFLFCSHSMLKP